MPCRRLLAGTERMQPAVDDRPVYRRHPLDGDDVAESERLEGRQIEAARELRHVRERVRVGRIAVLRGVGESPHAARVHDDHRRTSHCAAIMSI
jgi:hypothetical protein